MPNLYPALERHEVVVHGHVHRDSFADLPDGTIDLVAEAWQRRARETGGTVFAFVNEGFDAGASLPHSHSQLAWLPGPAPLAAAERGLPATVAVLERDGITVGCPVASRVPYELQLAPSRSEADAFRSDLLPVALRVLAELVARLRRLHRAAVPFNAWLHDGPHWHLEVVPRLTRLAGLELGAGVFVNPVAPESAAERLRGTDAG